jgi:hypothetical protein
MEMDIDYLRTHHLLLLECISGSKAYNLDVPSSDTDIRGVFYLPKEAFYGFHYVPQVANTSNDIVFYEIGRFLELLTKNNPNILELLAMPSEQIIYRHPIMERLKPEDFLSKKCKDTFGGYAFTQIRKARGLNKKIVNPVAKEKKTVLDFCYVLHNKSSLPLGQWLAEEGKQQEKIGLVNIPHFKDTYGLFYDAHSELGYKGIMKKKSATTVLLSSIPKQEVPLTYLHFNQDGYARYCKDYRDYWDWVDKRNESRYENNVQHGKNYDSKNMMHTFRLLDMALEILTEGKIKVRRDNRAELLKIRKGEWQYDELIEMAHARMEKVERACLSSTLAETPDLNKVEQLLIDIRSELYQ